MTRRAKQEQSVFEDKNACIFEGVGDGLYELQCGNVKINVSFAGDCSLEEAVSHFLAMRDNAAEAIQFK